MIGVLNKCMRDVDTVANMADLYNKQSDFDADKLQPHFRTEEEYDRETEMFEYETVAPFDPVIDDYATFTDYYRRLEDIPSDYIAHYIMMAGKNITDKSGSNGLITFENNHRVQPTLVSVDDNSDFTELADLQVEEDTNIWSEGEKSKALKWLPYTIKRLHTVSLYMQVHMLSFIRSYLIAKRKNIMRRNTGSSMTLKKNAVLGECVYNYKTPGICDKKIEISNKNQYAATVFEWIEGRTDIYPSYLEDVNNFIHYCKVLNIDLESDDMSKYDVHFVNRLNVLTLTPNKQYNKTVYNSLHKIPIPNTSVIVSDPILDTITTFEELTAVNPSILEVIKYNDTFKVNKYFEDGKTLHYINELLFGRAMTDAKKYYWKDGYLNYDNDIVIVSSNFITDDNFVDTNCIISETGYLIKVSNDSTLYMMPVSAALANVQARKLGTPDIDIAKWSRYST